MCVCGGGQRQRQKLFPKLSSANPYDGNEEKVKKLKKKWYF